jgi:TRAP-type C4-dicarboxylate transport system substrate-binding protein
VTYGVHKFHKFHTLTSHFYVSRPIFVHRATFDSWPVDVRNAMQAAVHDAVRHQRGLAQEEHVAARRTIEAAGCEIVETGVREHEAFVRSVRPLLEDARGVYGDAMFKMVR